MEKYKKNSILCRCYIIIFENQNRFKTKTNTIKHTQNNLLQNRKTEYHKNANNNEVSQKETTINNIV